MPRPNVCLLFLFVVVVSIASAAPPKVTSLFPAGAQRGSEVVVSATGDWSTWPAQMWSSNPAVVATAETDKGKFRLKVAADAVPDVVWLRAHNAEGASGLRPFVIGTLTELEEIEPNDSPAQGQSVPEKIVINGKLAKNGDVDGFLVALKQGQTLVASLQANHGLGSPMDAVMQICELSNRGSKKEAFVLAQNHDAHALDPEIVFTAPRSGEFLVRVFTYPAEPDSTINYAGRDDYVYRLTLTTGGVIDRAMPLAIERGKSTDVLLFGPNMPSEGVKIQATAPADFSASELVLNHADFAGGAHVALTRFPSLLEPQPQLVQLPTIVSGCIKERKEADTYSFMAKQGMRLRFLCETRSVGSPLRAVVKTSDASGKVLARAESSEPRRDTELVFTSPADGAYRVAISDEHDRGDSRQIYRLTVAEAEPDFGLTVASDNFVIRPGEMLEIPVTLQIQDALDKPIALEALQLPGGVTCEKVLSNEKPQSGQIVKLILRAAGDVPLHAGTIRIRGTASGLERFARTSPATPDMLWLTVAK